MRRKIRNIMVKAILLLFFGGFTVVVFMAASYGNHPLSAEKIIVDIDHNTGLFFLNNDEVEMEVRQLVQNSSSMEPAKLNELENRLSTNPYINEANAFIDSKGQLNIAIKQRKPIGRVVAFYGTTFYISDEGLKFPASERFVASVPLITGLIPEACTRVDTIQSEVLRQAVSVLKYAGTAPFWSAQIAQVHIDKEHSLSIIPRMGNHQIILGDASDLPEKLNKLSLLYQEVLNGIGWDAYHLIDLKYKNQIVCK